jgi:hypothetical protein
MSGGSAARASPETTRAGESVSFAEDVIFTAGPFHRMCQGNETHLKMTCAAGGNSYGTT